MPRMPPTDRPCRIDRRAALLLGIVLSAALPAEAREPPAWRIDPTHSRVVFDVEHAGFSYTLGVLSGPTGRLRYDPKTWDGAGVEARLPLSRLDFGNERWNRTMLGRRWFDAGSHPEIVFRSTRVEPIDATHAKLHGELTVRGTTAPVVLDLRRNAVQRHPLTLRRTAGFSATAELDRRAFGLDASPDLIGSAVRVRIEVEAIRTRQENDHAGPQHD